MKPQLMDVFLLPAGIDVFHAAPTDVRVVTVLAANQGEAERQEPVAALLRSREFYVVDSQTHGDASQIVSQIQAGWRQRRDAEEFASWDKGRGRDPEWLAIRGLLGSRPLGGG